MRKIMSLGPGPFAFPIPFFRSVQISVIRAISGKVFSWFKIVFFVIETKWPTVANFSGANQLRTWPMHHLESGHLDKTEGTLNLSKGTEDAVETSRHPFLCHAASGSSTRFLESSSSLEKTPGTPLRAASSPIKETPGRSARVSKVLLLCAQGSVQLGSKALTLTLRAN